MTITYNKILDTLFVLSIFSMIIMGNSYIGKGLQLLFVISTILIAFTKTKKITIYHFFEMIFVIYIFGQVVFEVAVLKTYTLDMAKTILYNALFSFGFYNYLIYRNDIKHVVLLYTKATIFAFILILLLYFNTLTSLRLDATEKINILGMNIFGGSSSTALSIMAVIPAFFLTIFPPKDNVKKAYPYVIFLMVMSLLTGTRKTIVLFIYILLFASKFYKKNANFLKIIKTSVSIILMISIVYLSILNIPFFYNIIGNRVENAILYYIDNEKKITDSSIIVRDRMIDKAISLFKEKPILGWGMDYFKYSNQTDLNYYSHNNFLEILSGGGIVGFILYYIKYLYLLLALMYNFLHKKDDNAKLLSCIGFFIIMIILEYWQITYIYRYIIIYQIFILYIVRQCKIPENIINDTDLKGDINK